MPRTKKVVERRQPRPPTAGTLILANDDVVFVREMIIPAAKLRGDFLTIDESYQRWKLDAKASLMSAILLGGGQIPDPPTVSERKNGRLYIVDGQQRYHAHWAANKDMRVRVVRCRNVEVEAKYFAVLNERTRVDAARLARTRPDSGGALLRWLNENPASPLYGIVSDHSCGRIPASTVAKCMNTLLHTQNGGGNKPGASLRAISDVMGSLEVLVKRDEPRARKLAAAFGIVLLAVWPKHRVYQLAAIALAFKAGAAWRNVSLTALPMPTKAEGRRLAAVNWRDLAPGNHPRFIGVLCDEIERRWSTNRVARAA